MSKFESFKIHRNIILDSFVIRFETGWNCPSNTLRFSRHRVAKRDEDKTTLCPCKTKKL